MKKDIYSSDFSIIIKRLELIKSLIALEEEQDIIMQVKRLETFETNDAVNEIISNLNMHAYGKAVESIDLFIKAHQQLAIHIDPEIDALKLEAKVVEAQINHSSEEKAELEKLIHEFSVKHNQELGELIIKILKHRKEKYSNTPQQEETEKDYQEFQTNFEATKDEIVTELNDEELKELKSKFRKASKLCHPDVVDESQQANAHKIFIELNNAYEKNDLQKVSEILESLLKVKAFNSKADLITEKEKLKEELSRLRKRLDELIKEILFIKSSDTYCKIISIADWNNYFLQTKRQLTEQLNELENDRK